MKRTRFTEEQIVVFLNRALSLLRIHVGDDIWATKRQLNLVDGVFLAALLTDHGCIAV